MLAKSFGSIAQPKGDVSLKIIRAVKPTPTRLTFSDVLRFGGPERGLPDEINRWRKDNIFRLVKPFAKIRTTRALGFPTFYGALHLKRIRVEASQRLLGEIMGEWAEKADTSLSFPAYARSLGFRVEAMDFGLASLKLVTDAGVGFIVDAFQNIVELEIMKYHGNGVGTTAESAAHTALVTELTTEYNPNSTRATGSTTETSANIYRTVGTNTVDATVAITEHGIFSQAATGGGVMFDRSVFAANNLVSGDSLQSTYDATFASGG